MNWWQIALSAWGVGALAAVPSVYEFNESSFDTEDLPPLWSIVALTIAGALLWPLAWVSLLGYAASCAVRP